VATRLPRELHPGAWWLWALGLAVAASRTTNPLLLAALIVVVFTVALSRAPRSVVREVFSGYLLIGLFVVALRVVFRIAFGGGGGTHVLFSLPEVPLPASSGIRAGGAVTLENIVGAFYDGLRLATLLICFGAANVLANPRRLLKSAPAALHEIGVAVTVAVTVAPQLVESARRVRRARRLRSGEGRRRHVVRQVVIPVMTDALDRSLMLAAAMDARGHGRTGDTPRGVRRVSGVLLLIGLIGVCVGTYGLLDSSASRIFGLPAFALGAACAAAGTVVGNRRVRTTTYRPAPWRAPEWFIAACGVVVALGVVLVARGGARVLNPSADLLDWPVLPAAAFGCILAGLLPMFAAPPSPSAERAGA
jgi:energy-coupling factor transport system permease protein